MKLLRAAFVLLTALSLTGCFPQWDAPPSVGAPISMPAFIKGAWASGPANKEIFSFDERGGGVITVLDSDGVYQFPIAFSRVGSLYLASVNLAEMSSTTASEVERFSDLSQKGFAVFALERAGKSTLIVRSIVKPDEVYQREKLQSKNVCAAYQEEPKNKLDRMTSLPCYMLKSSYFAGKSEANIRRGLGGEIIRLHRTF